MKSCGHEQRPGQGKNWYEKRSRATCATQGVRQSSSEMHLGPRVSLPPHPPGQRRRLWPLNTQADRPQHRIKATPPPPLLRPRNKMQAPKTHTAPSYPPASHTGETHTECVPLVPTFRRVRNAADAQTMRRRRRQNIQQPASLLRRPRRASQWAGNCQRQQRHSQRPYRAHSSAAKSKAQRLTILHPRASRGLATGTPTGWGSRMHSAHKEGRVNGVTGVVWLLSNARLIVSRLIACL